MPRVTSRAMLGLELGLPFKLPPKSLDLMGPLGNVGVGGCSMGPHNVCSKESHVYSSCCGPSAVLNTV